MQAYGNFMNMNMMNNFNNMGNQNQMVNQSLIVSNWNQMYTSNQPNFREQNNNYCDKKIQAVFKTGRGVITTIFIDYGKTVSYLIQVYFKRVGKPELFKRPLEIGFIYNARLINFNESKKVEDYFMGINNVIITVQDHHDFIGAKLDKISIIKI